MVNARGAGFALVDVLVALLLLAIVITGSCATLIHAMRVTREALFTTHAVDLVADMTEELRMASSIAQAWQLLPAWRERVRTVLPVAGLEPDEFATLVPAEPGDDAEADAQVHALRLRWHVGAGGMRELSVPVTLPPGAAQAR